MRLNDDGARSRDGRAGAQGIGEIIGGSQREERLDVLTSAWPSRASMPKHYWWYIDLRRYGTCRTPASGWASNGCSYITGMGNIRDVIPYPRTPGNAPF
jgi:asparaginyl-tRNA synthetase